MKEKFAVSGNAKMFFLLAVFALAGAAWLGAQTARQPLSLEDQRFYGRFYWSWGSNQHIWEFDGTTRAIHTESGILGPHRRMLEIEVADMYIRWRSWAEEMHINPAWDRTYLGGWIEWWNYRFSDDGSELYFSGRVFVRN